MNSYKNGNPVTKFLTLVGAYVLVDFNFIPTKNCHYPAIFMICSWNDTAKSVYFFLNMNLYTRYYVYTRFNQLLWWLLHSFKSIKETLIFFLIHNLSTLFCHQAEKLQIDWIGSSVVMPISYYNKINFEQRFNIKFCYTLDKRC